MHNKIIYNENWKIPAARQQFSVRGSILVTGRRRTRAAWREHWLQLENLSVLHPNTYMTLVKSQKLAVPTVDGRNEWVSTWHCFTHGPSFTQELIAMLLISDRDTHFKCWTTLAISSELGYENHTTGSHPKTVCFNFSHSVITTLWTSELARRQQYQQHLLRGMNWCISNRPWRNDQHSLRSMFVAGNIKTWRPEKKMFILRSDYNK
jgi:hypothetical protein